MILREIFFNIQQNQIMRERGEKMSETELIYTQKANKANLIYGWAVILLALVANLATNMPIQQLLFAIGLASSVSFLLTLLNFSNVSPYVVKWLTIVGITLYSYYNLYAAHGNGTIRAIFLFFEALIVVALYLDKVTIMAYTTFIIVTNVPLYFFAYMPFFEPLDSMTFFHLNVALIGCTILLIFITKWGKEMLHNSEARWHFVLEGNGDGVWDWDITKNVVYFSKQWKIMLGYKEDEIKNELTEWENRLHPEDRALVLETMHKHLRGETTYYATEHRILCKDGTYKWVLDRGKVMARDKEGNPLRLVCSHTDITYRKGVEDALRGERDRIQRYLDIAGVIMLVLDSRQNVTLINKKGSAILGYPEKEIIGHNWFDEFVPSSVREDLRLQEMQIIEGEVALEFNQYSESTVLTRNGEERLIAWQTVLLTDQHGKVKATLRSGEDITERKRVQERVESLQLQLIQKEKIASLAHLTAGVVHEINSPLGVIKSNTSMSDMLLSHIKGMLKVVVDESEEEVSKLVETTAKTTAHEPETEVIDRTQAEKLLKLVEKMEKSNQTNTFALDRIISMIKTMKKISELDEADWQIFDLHEIIENALVMMSEELENRITVLKRYGDLPAIRCIPGQITQAVLNILISRMQTIEGAGEITLETAFGGNFVYLTISDNGKGLTREQQSRIFDPSFTTRGDVVGMELGLAIAYNVVQSHRGEIVFNSQEAGGASFIIKLPV